ncbi:hypothetical protein NE237_023578 [Protea cynaroides]|uniref:Uncharacterized protein n=1 Tax=Protea cynaroides TaxID=273540 RepID=A0A9Q0HHC3_9MAGN|nr:hypothetical protein NE237_023578 [Protea cynaroides]
MHLPHTTIVRSFTLLEVYNVYELPANPPPLKVTISVPLPPLPPGHPPDLHYLLQQRFSHEYEWRNDAIPSDGVVEQHQYDDDVTHDLLLGEERRNSLLRLARQQHRDVYTGIDRGVPSSGAGGVLLPFSTHKIGDQQCGGRVSADPHARPPYGTCLLGHACTHVIQRWCLPRRRCRPCPRFLAFRQQGF